MTTYKITKTTNTYGESYGIKAYEGEKEIKTIENITVNYEEACILSSMLTKHEVSVIHFQDIVEDFLAEK